MTDLHEKQRYWLLDARAHVRAWNAHRAYLRTYDPIALLPKDEQPAARARQEAAMAKAKADRKRWDEERKRNAAKAEADRQAQIEAMMRKRDQLRRGWVDHRWLEKEDAHDIMDLPERRVVA
jgi:hypothetical protein